MPETIKAEATKDFFISMLTRDILLQDCILDLIDNSIDGANRSIIAKKPESETPQDDDTQSRYRGFEITLIFSKSSFSIKDNCGGISIDLAKSKVFYFGRPAGLKKELDGSIGLYGIGMKRAIFKLGTHATIKSSTEDEAFTVDINVPAWAAKKPWTLELERNPKGKKTGTSIEITTLTEPTSAEFNDPVFIASVKTTISRDYSFFLQKGMKITVNGAIIKPYPFALMTSSEIEPIHTTLTENGVKITIAAGLASVPKEDADPDSPVSSVDYFGWFVVCNDRIVLAADKTNKTVWGDDGFAVWHPQYNGFMGIVEFESDDAGLLPWSTTKRDVDRSSPIYKKAVAVMKNATREYIAYSGARKQSIKEARTAESNATPKSIRSLSNRATMKLPKVAATSAFTTVSYQVKKADLKRAASALGSPLLPATKVGQKTFEYYMNNEVEA
jgi:hypothetical protein